MTEDLLDRLKEFLASQYRIEEEIDRGGMAVVYLAEDQKHGRKVAIKVLRPALAATLGTERFLREIDVIAKLQHPHILTLIDSGEVDGVPYYVMPFVEGQSLRDMMEREGALPLEEAVRIACEVAGALETAHQRGVVHRDIKPANILISGGHAMVADFGIAAALDEAAVGRLTDTGVSLGSPAYMSPEQASGERDLDARTDVYGLGCVLYEMLGGKAPFEGSIKTLVTQKVLGKIQPLSEIQPELPTGIVNAVEKALGTERADRFSTAGEFRAALLAGLPQAEPEGWGRRQTLVASAVVLLVVLVAAVAIQRVRERSRLELWAAQTLAEAQDSADAGKLTEALELAEEVEAVFPGDTTLARLLPQISFTVPIRTDPPGATVYIQDWEGEGGEWEYLGVTPLEDVRFAGALFEVEELGMTSLEDRPHRIRFELEGYQTRELLKTAVVGVSWRQIPPLDPVILDVFDPGLEGMVRITGFSRDSIEYGDYFMDRYEVTNREFEEFVDAGGYGNPELWVHPFFLDGVELGFQEAMDLFRDQTGLAGPSTWRLGSFPEGQGEYPVGGVSWYEAAAYARWAGRELPTTLHLTRARRYFRENSFSIVPRSNLGSNGPRPVGENEAMATLGVYDLLGNVREWCYNEAGEGQRATRGGGWPDAPFLANWVIPKPAFDRDVTNGIRLIRTFDDEVSLEALRYPIESSRRRDYYTEEPASDSEFEVFRRFYAYDPLPLDAVVERVDTFEHWIREVVAFDVPYGERGGAALYFPRRGQGPFQPILYWGGDGILSMRSVEEEWTPGLDFMVRSGRAVAVPIFKGTYGREARGFAEGGFPGDYAGSTYRDATIQWVKDLSTTIDYLETREDIDLSRVGLYGLSLGAEIGPIPLVIDPRIGAAVLNVGGLYGARYFPEADPFHFLPRVRAPVLMINGQYDIVFPYETAQVPMYEFLGTPEEDKFHYLSPSSHLVPQDEVIRETLKWFDKYLGVVGGG